MVLKDFEAVENTLNKKDQVPTPVQGSADATPVHG